MVVLEKESPHVFVVTCSDPYVVLEELLNIQIEDGVGIVKNAGGHIEPALKDIIAIEAFIRVMLMKL